MRRFHLFEILDQRWCPALLRDGATDCLEAMIMAVDVYRPVREEFLSAVRRCGATRVVDLCSGGGGPWLSRQWISQLEIRGLKATLTDKFPSGELRVKLNGLGSVDSINESIDATRLPDGLNGFRTIFSSFHHFPDAMAMGILAAAVRSGEGFASAEVTARSPRAMLTMLLMPALVWAVTPRIRPFRWSRLLFTYLIPLIPFIVLWDGAVSCLRTRTPEELMALTRALPGAYEWKAGYAAGSGAWLPPVYLIGFPRAQVSPMALENPGAPSSKN